MKFWEKNIENWGLGSFHKLPLQLGWVGSQQNANLSKLRVGNTPPNSEIICAQNVSTKVVCGIIFFNQKKLMLKI